VANTYIQRESGVFNEAELSASPSNRVSRTKMISTTSNTSAMKYKYINPTSDVVFSTASLHRQQ
jgi:hypothetical protein